MSLAMDAIAQGNPLIGCASSFLYGFSDTITVYLQLYSKLDLKLISAFPYVFILVDFDDHPGLPQDEREQKAEKPGLRLKALCR